MSIFGKDFSWSMFDKDSFVFAQSGGRTASEIMSQQEQNLPNIKTAESPTITGDSQLRNPKFANFASPTTFGSFGTGWGQGLMYTSPQFYSPIHTAQNWQIPTKRREIYQWCVAPETLVTSIKSIGNEEYIIHEEIRNISPGTQVLTHKGNFKNVHALYERDVDEDIYKIHVNGIRDPLLVTGNHEIFALERDNVLCKYQKKRKHQRKCVKFHNNSKRCPTSEYCYKNEGKELNIKKIRVDKLSEKDYIYIPILDKESEEKEISSIFMARFLGYYLAEGHKYICEKRSQYQITLDLHKKEILSYGKEIENCVKNIFEKDINLYEEESSNRLRVSFQSKEACEIINKYIPGIAKEKKLNKKIMDMPKEWLLEFLGAYLNGDGSYLKKSEIHLITASEELARQIQFIYNKIGICTSKISKRKSELNGKTFFGYILIVPIGQCSELIKYCDRKNFEGFNHLSKSQSFIKKNKRFNYIKKIEKVHYKGKVYCLGVDDDESFVANGISISNCRFFSQNDPTIAAALRFFSQFPFDDYEHETSNPIIQDHFDNLKDKLRIREWLPMIAYQFFVHGDVFPFVNFSCEKCQGHGFLRDGTQCDHENGKVTGITVLDPNAVEVKPNYFNPMDPTIYWVPDDNIKKIVWDKQPLEVYNKIPAYIKEKIMNNQQVLLSKKSVTHLKNDPAPYETYGHSLLQPLFPMLAYQDKLRQAQWIVAERHILPIKICKVGNDQRPAGPADIADTQRQLAATANDPNLTLVVHHAFEFCYDEKTEVLTENGWKVYHEVKNDEKIMVYDKNSKKMYYDNFDDRYENKNYEGNIIYFKNKDNIDICVTPNHRMLTKKINGKEWEVLEAKDIKEKYLFNCIKNKQKLDFITTESVESIENKKYKGLIWCFSTKTGFFVTRRNGKITIQGNSWEGAAGKVLQLTKEYDLIEKAIIQGLGVNEALLSGCIPEYSRILTNDGFKNLEEFDQEKHLVATLNPETHKFEWGKATYTHVVEYNSVDGFDPPLVHFKNKNRLDNLFTNGHEMYVKKRNKKSYKKIRADEVGHHDKFILRTNGWDGNIPKDIDSKTMGIPLDLFLEISAYFISEGSFLKEYNRKIKTGETYICKKTGKKRTNRKKIGLSIVQSVDSDIINSMFDLDKKLKNTNFHIHHWIESHNKKSDTVNFRLNSVKLAKIFFEYFGEYSYGKKIPNWIKELPKENLEKFIYHLVKCDGTERESNRKNPNGKKYLTYTSCSESLIHSIAEILLKLGYSPVMKCADPNKYESSKKFKNPEQLQYTVAWSELNDNGAYPCVRQANDRKNIFKKEWKGKVWCVTVPPNHLVLFENNGKMVWAGNTGPSYSQAAIGIEATIRRLESVRNIFAQWIREKIYKAEAQMRGFVKETSTGEIEYDYPKIRWKDLNLRDDSQQKNLELQLWDKKIVSTQHVCEQFDIDYDTETERIRLETEYQQQLGIPQGEDEGGGLGGGLGGLGGGFGGGGGGGLDLDLGGGGDDNSGNLPGGQSGPGLPGDSNAPSMSGGESVGDYDLKLKAYERAKEEMPSVHRPGKFKLKKPESPEIEEQKNKTVDNIKYKGRTGQFRLTSIEFNLYKKIKEGQQAGNLPLDFVIQQKPEPIRMSKVVVDGFFPSIKLIVQADGKLYHSQPDQIEKDKEIDSRFRSLGWTVLRFTEDEINHNINEVLAAIIGAYKEIQEKKQIQSSLVEEFEKES